MSVIEVEHLRKSYGDTVAVSDVSFSVEEGEIFGILGPNGAGKTTTVETHRRACASRTRHDLACSGSTPGATATGCERSSASSCRRASCPTS